jgi:hypothetical protein
MLMAFFERSAAMFLLYFRNFGFGFSSSNRLKAFRANRINRGIRHPAMEEIT